MASLVNGMAKEIFQILKGSGRTLSLFDEHGNKVFEPESAISFFAEPDKLMVTINQDGSDSSLNMYVSEVTDIDDIKKMIDTLRVTATRHNFLFNIRKYGRELNPKDFAFTATPMVESMYGSTKTSYQNIGKSKIIVRHSAKVSEEVRGARSRRISSIFVETAQGERFKFPNTSLHGARAFAKHLDAGGDPRDNYSTYVFAECDKQQTINGFRRRIRKLGEANEDIAELGTLLKKVVEESKSKITKAKGNRFYSGIVESIKNAPNHIGPLRAEIAEQANQLKTLLAIDETSALFPALESVATIILEMKQMEPINFEETTLLKTFVSEQAEAIEDLVESLVGEFGLEEGVHFERSEAGVSMLDESAYEQAQLYTSGKTALTLQESAQDKFLAYATHWVKNRLKNAGMDQLEMSKADPHAQAAELAQGLKQVVAGNLPITIKSGDSPKFANPVAAIAYKLDKILAPGSGLKNDALFNFISAIDYKLSHGDSMDANERFFAQKLADIVDKHAMKDEAIMPEMNELEEWMKGYGLQEAGPYDVVSGDSKFEEALDNFDMEAFLEYANSDLNKQMDFDDPEDRFISRNAVESMVRHYLDQVINYMSKDEIEIDRYEPQIDAFVDSDVIPALGNIGITVQANEGLDESLFKDELNEELDENQLKQMILDALKQIDSGDYYGVISGDDEYEDGMNLMRQVGKVIGYEIRNQIENLDVDDIIEMARQVWTNQTESAEPIVEDAYDDKAVEVIEEYKDLIAYLITNRKTQMIKLTEPEEFDEQTTDELVEDLISDTLGHAAQEITKTYGEDWGLAFLQHDRGAYKELWLFTFNQLEDIFPIDKSLVSIPESTIDEARGYDANAVKEINMRHLKHTIDSFVRKLNTNDPQIVYDAMAEFYMDSRSMGPLFYEYKPEIMKAITNAMKVTEDAIDADMGDDFVQDITYKQDAASEADYIARLRKLAGI